MNFTDKINQAVEAETLKLASSIYNIETAVMEGQISEGEGQRRIDKAQDWADGRIAWITRK